MMRCGKRAWEGLEIDISRVANLMLKRNDDQAEAESAVRSAELAPNDGSVGAAGWRRVTDAVGQLVNRTPPRPVRRRL